MYYCKFRWCCHNQLPNCYINIQRVLCLDLLNFHYNLNICSSITNMKLIARTDITLHHRFSMVSLSLLRYCHLIYVLHFTSYSLHKSNHRSIHRRLVRLPLVLNIEILSVLPLEQLNHIMLP